MRRRANIDSLTGPLRAYYGLTQTDVAGLLGTTRALVAQADAVPGRSLPFAALMRLGPLLQTLPPPHGAAPPEAPAAPDPVPALGTWPARPPGTAQPPAAEVLAPRLDACHFEARQLAQRLLPLERRARQATRLLALLPRLPLPPPAGVEQPPHPHPDALARTLAYLGNMARSAIGPVATAEWFLLATRRAALLHEAAALAGAGA